MSDRPILLVQTPWDTRELWAAELRAALPELEVRVWPDDPAPGRVVACAVWQPPAELLAGHPGLRVIQSLGAGLDHLWKLGAALPDLPVLRLVDPVMTERLAHYVLAGALLFQRRFDVYLRQQRERRWVRHAHADPAATIVGVLGMGVMGEAVARLLQRVGFSVLGWRRSSAPVQGIEVHSGPDGLTEVAGRADILVSVLPATPATRGLLAAPLFAAMRPGACLISAGRGEHLVVPDLLAALDGDRLGGALLDVFATEPLPEDDPLWAHPKVIVTPHTAAISNPRSGAAAIATGLRAALRGDRPASLALRDRGY
jgi:glyoxylate/hydroxypyruvate reductase A